MSQKTSLPPKHASVIITRPLGQETHLVQVLNAQNRQVYCMPLIKIEPIFDEQIKSRFLNLDNYQFVFPVSANAVNIAMQWVDKYWPQLPVGLTWLAVGPASKQALENNQIPPSSIIMPTDNYASEGLLKLEALQTGDARRVLILRADSGRSLFANTLEARGFKVEVQALYNRTEIQHSQIDWEKALEKPAIVQINSSQTLDIALKQEPRLPQKSLGVIVPSKRIAQQAQSYFKQVWISSSACDKDILNALS